MSRIAGSIGPLVLAAALALMPYHAADAAGPRPEPIKIGIGGPFPPANAPTGDKVFGDQMRTGVEQAVADINGSGGLLGHKLKIVIGNDGSDPKRGVEVAKGLLKTGVRFVIGHFTSAVTVPASEVYAEAGVLEITPSATGDLVTDRGIKTLFRTCGREDQQAGVAARYLLSHHYERIALVHDRSPLGKQFVDDVRKILAAAGVTDVASGSLAEGTRNIGDLAGRVRMANAQIVVYGGSPSGAAQVVRRLHDADPPIPLLGGTALASDEFASQAGTAADGSMTIFPQDPLSRPAAASLLHRLQDKDKDTGAYVFNSYASVEIIRQSAEATHSLDPKLIAAHMHSGVTFQTVLGPISFDAKGDPKTTDLGVYVWHKGATGRWNFLTPAGS